MSERKILTFCQKGFGSLSKMRSTCPAEQFEEKYFCLKKVWIPISFGLWKKIQPWSKTFWQGCHFCNLSAPKDFFKETCFAFFESMGTFSGKRFFFRIIDTISFIIRTLKKNRPFVEKFLRRAGASRTCFLSNHCDNFRENLFLGKNGFVWLFLLLFS